MNDVKRRTGVGGAFLAIGAALLVIGLSGQRAFVPIGMVFVIIGIAMLARARKR